MSSQDNNRFPLITISCPADCDFDAYLPATYGLEAQIFVNTCIRGLNSIYYNAPRVKPGDEGDFAGYCLSTLAAISGHQYETLEKLFFPVLQKKYDVTPYVQQHASYRDQLNTLTEYLKTVAGKGPYDGQKVRELLDSFGDQLVKTLSEETNTLDPERLKEYDENEVLQMLQAHRAELKKLILETPMCVFAVTHHDIKTAPTWPPKGNLKHLDGPLDQIKVYIDTQAYWKFAPYTVKQDGETQTYA